MFDLATAKARLGIAVVDTTKDTLLSGAISAALSIAENYCDRKFLYAAESQKFNHFHGATMSLIRYPLVNVTSVAKNGAWVSGYKVISSTGQIEFDHPVRHDELTVQYTGGYTVLPDDLLLALWRIFDAIWSDMPGGGAAAGAAAGSQAISSIAIPDVGTIRFEASGAAGGAGAGAAGGLIDNVTAALLSFYRREKC